MRLAQQNIAEVWEADGKLTVPIGTIAYHLESKKTCAAGSKLKRADRHGRLLVCREKCTIQLREVPVALRRGQAGTCVHVVWCSLELVASDPAVLAGELPDEETPLRFEELEEEFRASVHDALQSHAEEHDLTTRPGQTEIRARILPEIHVSGFEVKAFTFRRVLTQEEYTDEKRVWAEFQSGLKRVIQDETLADAARTGELEKALGAIENDNIRALLTEQENTLAAAARLTKYVDLFPPQQPAQAEQSPQPCPHPHCRLDLSIGQTFDCRRCGDRLHVWHRSARKPAVCDQCDAAMTTGPVVIACVVILLFALICAGAAAVWWYRTGTEEMAVRLVDAKDYAGAFHAYCRLSDRDLADIWVHQQIEKCARLGDLRQQFLRRYLKLVEQYPDNAVLRNYLGNAYLMLNPKDPEGSARREYERALQFDSSFAPPLNNLAILAYRVGDRGRAESLFTQYLRAVPDDAEAWTNLATLQVMNVEKNPDGKAQVRAAQKALRRAIEIDPGLARRYKWAGRLFQATGRPAEALVSYRVSLRLEPGQPFVKQQIELLEWEPEETRKPTMPGSIEDQIDMVTRALRQPNDRTDKQ